MGGCVLGGGGGGWWLGLWTVGVNTGYTSKHQSWKAGRRTFMHLLRAVCISQASLADRDDLFHKNNFWAT